MSAIVREAELVRTFAKLADTLVAEYDVVDLLQVLVDACRDILGASAAGILLAGDDNRLELVASTSEASRLVELIQLAAQAGPCIEAFATGEVVTVHRISESPPEWSAFRESAVELGFGAVTAIPMKLREHIIGTLNLLVTGDGPLEESDLTAARAFADVATIGILQERSIRRGEQLTAQLQHALRSRVIIEQAKGVVAHTHGVAIDEAFEIIRAYARSHQQSLSGVAARLVSRELVIDPRQLSS